MNLSNFKIGTLLDHLPTARRMDATHHAPHAQTSNETVWATRARRIYEIGVERTNRRLPWQVLLPRWWIQPMSQDAEARRWLQRAWDLHVSYILRGRAFRTARRQERQVTVTRVQFPAQLDTAAEDYERNCSRLRYVRNLLLSACEGDTVLAVDVVVNSKQYNTMDVHDIARLLRPWYDNQWEMASTQLAERAERRAARRAEEELARGNG